MKGELPLVLHVFEISDGLVDNLFWPLVKSILLRPHTCYVKHFLLFYATNGKFKCYILASFVNNALDQCPCNARHLDRKSEEAS